LTTSKIIYAIITPTYFYNDDNGKDLKEKFNRALDDMRKDGTLKEISNKWFKLNITDR